MAVKIKNLIIPFIITLAVLAAAGGTLYYFFVYRATPVFKTGIVSLKTPDGWEKIKSYNTEKGVGGIFYKGHGTIEEAAYDFNAEMAKIGWNNKSKDVFDDFSVYTFEKKGYIAALHVYDSGKDMVSASVLAAESHDEPGKVYEIPKDDADGEDISDIPRFPGSIRTLFENMSGEIIAEYSVVSDLKSVCDFYYSILEEKGWVVEHMNSENEMLEIAVSKIEKGFATIEIAEISKDKGIIHITIVYTPF